jgi:hypothetical protein
MSERQQQAELPVVVVVLAAVVIVVWDPPVYCSKPCRHFSAA